jgi:hypothetical protein
LSQLSENNRTPKRRARDEQIAAEPKLPPDAVPAPMEAHLARQGRPLAVPGIVKNGLVRFLDSSINLPENARVNFVAAN